MICIQRRIEVDCLLNDSYVDVELYDGGTAEDPIVTSNVSRHLISDDYAMFRSCYHC